MAQRLRIALVAHDAKKDALVGWAKRWEARLAGHALLGTGSSDGEVERACPSLRVERLRSGPEGGDMHPRAATCRWTRASWKGRWTRWCSCPTR